MKLKKLLTFQAFVINERKLNEGGGAGVEVKMNQSIGFEARYQLNKDSVRVLKVEIDEPKTFDALGYDDGIHDVGTWTLESDLSNAGLDSDGSSENLAVDIKKFHSIKLEDIGQTLVESIALSSGDFPYELDNGNPELTDANWDKIKDNFKTVGDLFEQWPKLALEISFDISFVEYEKMHYAGWSRGKIKRGDVVIGDEGTKYDLGDDDTITIGNDDNKFEMYWSGDDVLESIIIDIRPLFKANKYFVQLWDSIFMGTPDETELEHEEEFFQGEAPE